MPEPSLAELKAAVCDEFWHAGGCTGSLARDCRHGKTFFEDDERAGDWNEGELEDLRAKAKAQPDKYIPLGGSTHFSEMLGYEWCWDCEECLKEALKYQNFIWSHRFTISRFINAKLATNLKQAADEQTQCTTTPK